jgi:hypothetical protein
VKRPRRPKTRKPGRSLLLRDRTPETGTEPIPRIPGLPGPASYDGRRYETEPPAPWRPPGERFADPRTWRGENDIGIMPAPAQDHSVALRGGTMTVYADAPGIPMDTRLRRARDFIELEVADLAALDMLYRIDDAEQARQRGEDPDERSLIAVTVAKAARHLMGPREPWDPR